MPRKKIDPNIHKVEVKNEEGEFVEMLITSGALHEEIFLLESNEPPDKRSVAYKAWKKEINQKMKRFNKLIGWHCYKLIL